MNRVKRTLYLLFLLPMSLLSVLTAVYLFSRTEPVFLLKNVRIKGADQMSESEILAKVQPYLKDSIFTIDMDKMRQAVASDPLIRDVRVKRLFPFSILIEVKERVPSALWVGPGGEVRVLDEDGSPFRGLRKERTGGLFVINARQKADARQVFREVADWDREGIIRKDDLSEVACNDGNVTLYSLGDGVEIMLGREERAGRLKRAMAVLRDAKKRGLLIRCIDARFEDGAIVKERKG